MATVLLLTSCEWDPIMFDDSKSHVAFNGNATTIPEAGGTVSIVVRVSALTGSPAVTVNFDFDTVGIDPAKAAFEGEQFILLNDSKTLTFNDGLGYDTIQIQPVDNDIFTGNKLFNIRLVSNSEDYPFGEAVVHSVTVADNEHPLGKWIGSYSVALAEYASYFGDEVWAVSSNPDPDDVNVLVFSGLGGASYAEFNDVKGTVDLEAMTITIPGGTEIGTHGNYGGPLSIFVGDQDGNVVSESDPIIGTLSDDGTIVIDNLAIHFTGGNNAGLTWGTYKSTWTKTARKSVPATAVKQSEVKRLN